MGSQGKATATLAGHTAIQASVMLGSWGVWWADATLDEAVTLSGAVELVIADLHLHGTIVSGGPTTAGRSYYRIAGGAGGWGKTIPSAGYANDAGVKLSTVLGDAARACGESLAGAPTTPVGDAYVRPEDTASRVMQLLVPAGWYVGEDGITRVGKRPSATLSVPAVVKPIDRAAGRVELAANSIATILPGVVVEGIEAVDVYHQVDAAEGLHTTIWGAGVSTTSRRLAALKRLIAGLFPEWRYRSLYEYRIVTQEGERLNLQPVRVSLGMPMLRRVRVRPGMAGSRATWTPGALVLVGFVNADPARPVVVSADDAESGGFRAGTLEIDAANDLVIGEEAHFVTLGSGSPPGVARLGDSVASSVSLLYAGPGTLTAVPNGTPGSIPIPGTITSASSKVKAQ